MGQSTPVARTVVEAFYEAFAARDPKRFAAYLHDDVVWTISGPVDVLPFCGTHRGKPAVVDIMARQAPKVVRVFNVLREAFLVDGDRASSLSRLSARRTSDGRIISYRVANFFRFQDGKLIENLSVMDSFDAAEQVLGHALAGHDDMSHHGNMVAL